MKVVVDESVIKKYKYVITRLLTSTEGEIEINATQYDSIKTAEPFLIEAFYIEEKFDLLISNYFDYELYLLKCSSEYLLYSNHNYQWFQKQRNSFNKHFINLLTSCRLYIDQISHHISNLYDSKSPQLAELKKYINSEYDNNLSYRLMDSLRNYMQHRGYPVQNITFNSAVVGKDDNKEFKYTLTPYIIVSDFEDDNKFKRKIIKEIKLLGKKIDIKPLVREYIGCYSRIHNKVRSILSYELQKSEKIFLSAMDQFKDKYGNISALYAIIEDEEGGYHDKISIFPDIIDHRKFLQNKNRSSRKITQEFCYKSSYKR